MSISDTDVDNKYSANGVTVDFAIPHQIIEDDSEETVVYLVDESVVPAVETLQVEGALQDYTLVGASPPTTPFNTTVRFNVAPTNGLKVFIRRALELIQEVDLTPGQAVPLDTIELMSDRLTAITQDLERLSQRTVKLRQSNRSLINPTLCDFITKGAALIINDTLDGLIEGPTAANLIAVAAAAAASAAAAAASAANAANSEANAAADAAAAASSAAAAAAYAGNYNVDTFVGDGILDHFTLAFDPLSKNNTIVFVDEIYQPKASYTVVGALLTLGGVVPNGGIVEVISVLRGTIVSTPSGVTVTSPILDSQTNANAVGLFFDGTDFRSITIIYYIRRYTVSGGTERVQSGKLTINFNTTGSTWSLAETDRLNEAGVDFDILPSGQVVYTSDAQAGTINECKMVSSVQAQAV